MELLSFNSEAAAKIVTKGPIWIEFNLFKVQFPGVGKIWTLKFTLQSLLMDLPPFLQPERPVGLVPLNQNHYVFFNNVVHLPCASGKGR
jgi:predicted nucleotidyltransferase